MPLMTPLQKSVVVQAIELVHLTSRHENVLHDDGEYGKSHSMVPSLASARRKEKKKIKPDCLVGEISLHFRVLRANSGRV